MNALCSFIANVRLIPKNTLLHAIVFYRDRERDRKRERERGSYRNYITVFNTFYTDKEKGYDDKRVESD